MDIAVIYPLPLLPVYQLRGSKWWVVLDDHTFEFFIGIDRYRIFVPAGYRYDRASIWWEVLITKDHLGCQGPLIHDILCRYHGRLAADVRPGSLDPLPGVSPYRVFTRPEADDIFYEVMLADHVSPWRAWVARQAVRLGRNWK